MLAGVGEGETFSEFRLRIEMKRRRTLVEEYSFKQNINNITHDMEWIAYIFIE